MTERSCSWWPYRFCVQNVPVLSDLSQQAFKEKRQRKTRYWDVDSDGEEVGVTEGIRQGWKRATVTWIMLLDGSQDLTHIQIYVQYVHVIPLDNMCTLCIVEFL